MQVAGNTRCCNVFRWKVRSTKALMCNLLGCLKPNGIRRLMNRIYRKDLFLESCCDQLDGTPGQGWASSGGYGIGISDDGSRVAFPIEEMT